MATPVQTRLRPPEIPELEQPELEQPELRDASSVTALTKMLEEGSPVLDVARRRGISTAQRRGLLNTTLAAEAGEQAVIREAAPFALQDASTIASENLLAQQTYAQRVAAQEEFGFEKELRSQDITAQEAAQERDIEGRSRLIGEAAEIETKRDVRQQAFDIEKQANDNVAAMERLGVQVDNQQAIAVMDANTRLQMNTENLNVQERFNTGSFMLETENNYNRMLAAIASNPEIPANVRQRMEANALAVRNTSQNMIESLYGTDLSWAPEPEAAKTTGTGETVTKVEETIKGLVPTVTNDQLRTIKKTLSGGGGRAGRIWA